MLFRLQVITLARPVDPLKQCRHDLVMSPKLYPGLLPFQTPILAATSSQARTYPLELRATLEGLSLTAPLVDSEAPEGRQIVAEQAAISRLCMFQDASGKLAEMVDRSSPDSDGPASLSGSGVGTDLVPGLGSTDRCVPCGHPSQT
jgi:hypothetical protein